MELKGQGEWVLPFFIRQICGIFPFFLVSCGKERSFDEQARSLVRNPGFFFKKSSEEVTSFLDPMKILVDADACPRAVLRTCIRLGRKYNVPVWTVASFNHRIESDHPIAVGDGFQEADIKIVNLTEAGDVVVTADWGLAAMVLGKGAICLSPIGREFHPERMDFLLEERDLKAKFRRGGGRTKGPRKRTSEDDRRFEVSLEKAFFRK